MFPNQLYEVVFEEELSTTNISVRLYGGALLSKSLPKYIVASMSQVNYVLYIEHLRFRDGIGYDAIIQTHYM